MKISSVKIKDFRGYKSEVEIPFDDLTVFVGKNDVGKSTILEALYIFFNEGKDVIIKPDSDDICKYTDADSFSISVAFDDLPAKISIDDTNETTLQDEYMLNKDGKLEIVKVFGRAKGTPKSSSYIRAFHPTNPKCSDLLLKKQKDLQTLVAKELVECNKNFNAEMRKAVWRKYVDDLWLDMVDIDASKEDAKKILDKLVPYMPVYSLFQSDRKNSDGDKVVQDPLKEAVDQIIADENLQQQLTEVAQRVRERLQEVAEGTLEKLKEMDESVANSLNPKIPSVAELKWSDVFKAVSISGDDDIPINKRGSGVKRLILLNFFRAEAERRAKEKGSCGVIYAIEEPETSQHNANQKILADALRRLSEMSGVQVVLTTHSAHFVKQLQLSNLRLIKDTQDGDKQILNVEKDLLGYVSLNEVNYLAFDEISEEYHNELYGYIKYGLERWTEFKDAQPKRHYISPPRNTGTPRPSEVCISQYIRDQIHHPENHANLRFTRDELRDSILTMRTFIAQCKAEEES